MSLVTALLILAAALPFVLLPLVRPQPSPPGPDATAGGDRAERGEPLE